jgi:hypothetical protein
MGEFRVAAAKPQTGGTVLGSAAIRRGSSRKRAIRSGLVGGALALGAAASIPNIAMADEGGVSFWVPGFFGSLAAAPQQPGWSLASIYYHTSVSAGSDVALAREFQLGRIPANLTANLSASLNATGDLGFAIPSYVFASPILGAQASASLLTAYGTTSANLTGTLTGSLTGPGGTVIPLGPRSDSISSAAWGFADVIPQFALRWNAGVDSYMTYVTGDIPVGVYSSSSLANLGIGHGAIDAGGGYTYFNPATGHEFSAVLGLTYNFANQATQYQNGIDMHLDLGASQFISKQVLVGMVGYVYDQLSCDSGSGDRVGCFESRVAGIGPQIGYIFPVGGMQGYLNFKGYEEFDSSDRPKGWNAWVTFVLSPAAATPPTAPKRPMFTK